jgi:hypothetical protein
MGCIADQEDVKQLCISEGCPAVSVNFLARIAPIIDNARKPILLWIFDSNLEQIADEDPIEDLDTFDPSGNMHHNCSVHEYER